MALPSTGPISLLDIFKEKFFKDSDYPDPPHGMQPVSLTEMTIGTSFFPSRDPNYFPETNGVNTESTIRPNPLQPHAMSEFRGYNEDAITTVGSQYYDLMKRQGQGLNSLTTAFSHPSLISQKDILIPLYTDFPFDFQGPILDGYLTWRQVDLPIDEFRSAYIRPIILFKQNGSGEFRNDVAISGQWVFLDVNKIPIIGIEGEYVRWDIKPNYYYSSGAEKSIGTNPFEDPLNPASVVAWKPILFDDDIVATPDLNGAWTIDGESTPTGDTGPNEEILFNLDNTGDFTWYSSLDDRNEYEALDSYNNRTKYLFYESSGVSSSPTYNWVRWNNYVRVPANASYLTFCYDAYSTDDLTWNDDQLRVYVAADTTDPTPATTFTQIAFKLGIKLYTGANATSNLDPKVLNSVSGSSVYYGWRIVNYDLEANGFNAGRNIRPYAVFNQSNVDLRNDVALSGEWRFLDENFNELETAWILDHDYPSSVYSSGDFERLSRDIAQRSLEFVAGSTRENPQDVALWGDIPYIGQPNSIVNTKWSSTQNGTGTSGTGPDIGVRYYLNYTGNIEWTNVIDSGFIYYESSGSGYSVPLREWFRWKNFRTIPFGAKYLSFCYNALSEDGENDYLNDYLKVFIEADSGITPPPINFP